MAEIVLTTENFEEKVLKADKPVLVDFWATWCMPCRMMAPMIAQIAEENADTLYVGKVDVDEQSELAARYRISSIPCLIAFKNGQEAARTVGVQDKATLLKTLGL